MARFRIRAEWRLRHFFYTRPGIYAGFAIRKSVVGAFVRGDAADERTDEIIIRLRNPA
jgi:hypothetical protein